MNAALLLKLSHRVLVQYLTLENEVVFTKYSLFSFFFN